MPLLGATTPRSASSPANSSPLCERHADDDSSCKRKEGRRRLITFRWFGPRDPIPLSYIRQIPAVRGIVGSLFDIPVGEPWPLARIAALREEVDRVGLPVAVIESIPVHEDIKLGRPTRDRLIDNYCESVRAMGELGVHVLCYNFMPVF